jgi:anti-sigma B factor antagonist
VLVALDVWSRAGWTVISVTGELDLSSAPRLRQAVVGAVGEGRAQLVLDLTGVDLVDSAGLGVVVGAQRRVRSWGGRLVVAGLEGRVRAVFELARLDEILELAPTLDDALRRAGTGREDGSQHG